MTIDIVSPYMDNIVEIIKGPVVMYGSMITVHYLSTHLYANMCTNWSFYGFLSSPIMTSTPVCSGLSWVIYEGSQVVRDMWVVLGTTMSIYLMKRKNI
jgi:hypothetical protein|tara:strand:+ start:1096 stop:1389 length:294 start_codon:yes stop_codon:yes gene_type:complete